MFFVFIVKIIGGYYSLRQKYLKRIYILLLKGYQYATNSYLPFTNQINGEINFLHGAFGVFISEGAKIGKNCTIYHQVTIGSHMLMDSKKIGSPQIGDNCFIGAGAKIVGNIKIGNNCRIGANAVVTQNIPDNCVVVLSKPTIIQKDKLDNTVYQYRNGILGYLLDGKFQIEENNKIINKLNYKFHLKT